MRGSTYEASPRIPSLAVRRFALPSSSRNAVPARLLRRHPIEIDVGKYQKELDYVHAIFRNGKARLRIVWGSRSPTAASGSRFAVSIPSPTRQSRPSTSSVPLRLRHGCTGGASPSLGRKHAQDRHPADLRGTALPDLDRAHAEPRGDLAELLERPRS